jgi:uncharacterized membrane protein
LLWAALLALIVLEAVARLSQRAGNQTMVRVARVATAALAIGAGALMLSQRASLVQGFVGLALVAIGVLALRQAIHY